MLDLGPREAAEDGDEEEEEEDPFGETSIRDSWHFFPLFSRFCYAVYELVFSSDGSLVFFVLPQLVCLYDLVLAQLTIILACLSEKADLADFVCFEWEAVLSSSLLLFFSSFCFFSRLIFIFIGGSTHLVQGRAIFPPFPRDH